MQNNVASVSSTRSKYKKGYHAVTHKLKGKHILEPGLKGFLCSCNFREKDCIRESYNLLNEYADILFKTADSAEDELLEVEEDIENLLNEIHILKSQNKPEQKRFQVVDSRAKNLVFIRTTVDDPVKLAHSILKDIHEDKKQKTRFLLRLIPIEVTCYARVDNIKQACKPLIQKYFTDAPLSYSIVFNHRYNNSLVKMDVITAVADLVSSARPDHTVNLKDGQISILIEIIMGIALIGVVPDFMKYKKYNIHVGVTEETAKHY